MTRKIRNIVSIIISFMLTLDLFVFTFCCVLEVTLFNESFIIDNLNAVNYYEDAKAETLSLLKDLGYASGLEEEFFKNTIDEITLVEDVNNYINAFYTGGKTVVDTTRFRQKFNEALDEYIAEKNIDKNSVDASSRTYLIAEAAKIYAQGIKIPFLTTLANYFDRFKTPLMILTIVTGVLFVGICLILFFSNKWKHRGIRYIYYGAAGGFLSVLILPVVTFASGKIGQVNLTTRSAYNLFVSCANNFFLCFLAFAVMLFLLSLILYVLYKKEYKKVI